MLSAHVLSEASSVSIFFLICDTDELFDVSLIVLVVAKISFSAEAAVHLRDPEARISSLDSISLVFTIVALISDKSHDICSKADGDSSIMLAVLISNDDFCRLVDTDQSIDSEATDFSEIFVI